MKLSSSVVTTSSTPSCALQQRRARAAAARRPAAAASIISGNSSQGGSSKPAAAVQAADRDGGQRAGVELALGADVEEPRLERDRGREAGEDQRRRARQRLAPGEAPSRSRPAAAARRCGRPARRPSSTSSALTASVKATAPIGASTQRARASGVGARLEPHARDPAAVAPAIARPIASRVQSRGRARLAEPAARASPRRGRPAPAPRRGRRRSAAPRRRRRARRAAAAARTPPRRCPGPRSAGARRSGAASVAGAAVAAPAARGRGSASACCRPTARAPARRRPAAAHVEAPRSTRAHGARAARAPDHSRRARTRAAQALGHRVLPHRQVADHADRVPVFGNARDAAPRPAARVGAAAARPISVHACPRSRARVPHSSSASASWPLPETPAIATISPARSVERHVVAAGRARRRRCRTPSQRADRVARAGAPGAARGASTACPTIHCASCACVVLGGARLGHQPAAAQHRDAVRHAQHLVELVADEDDRQALRHHLRRAWRTAPRSPAASAPRSARRGSGCARRGTAPSGSRRAGARRPTASPTRASGSTGRPKRCADVEQPARAPRAARERLPQRLGAEHHVVEHGEVVGQREVLVHHADAGRQRGARVARRQRLAERPRSRPASAT